MAIFVDTVDPTEARASAELGFIAGVTTNPSLIAKVRRPAFDVISDLLDAGDGIVFHQVASSDADAMEAEAERFLALDQRVALKVPCTLQGARLIHRLHRRAICAVTAVYSPAQAYLFGEAGARYVIPYVNRAGRQGMAPYDLVRELASAIAAKGGECEVLAASLKSPEEVAASVAAGAKHVTVPWNVFAALADHPLTEQALAEFAEAARA